MRPAARGRYATNRAILRSSSRSPYPRWSHAKRPERPIVRWIARRALRQPQGSSVLSLHGALGIIINGRGVIHQNTQEANPSISRAGHRSSGSRLSADVQLCAVQARIGDRHVSMTLRPESVPTLLQASCSPHCWFVSPPLRGPANCCGVMYGPFRCPRSSDPWRCWG